MGGWDVGDLGGRGEIAGRVSMGRRRNKVVGERGADGEGERGGRRGERERGRGREVGREKGKRGCLLEGKGTRLDISIGVIRPPTEKSHFLWRRRKSDRSIHFT